MMGTAQSNIISGRRLGRAFRLSALAILVLFAGLLTGAVIGLFQDALTHQAIGLYGIAKTVVGYVASSLGVKLDLENPGARLMVTFGFYILHEVVYFLVARLLVREAVGFRWGHLAFAALCNAALAVILFMILDRFKRRA